MATKLDEVVDEVNTQETEGTAQDVLITANTAHAASSHGPSDAPSDATYTAQAANLKVLLKLMRDSATFEIDVSDSQIDSGF